MDPMHGDMGYMPVFDFNIYSYPRSGVHVVENMYIQAKHLSNWLLCTFSSPYAPMGPLCKWLKGVGFGYLNAF